MITTNLLCKINQLSHCKCYNRSQQQRELMPRVHIMKLHLPLRLLSSLLALTGFVAESALAAESFTAAADLGTVMYVGDSITHGISSGSWRWGMHKILTDNAVSYNAVGVMTGNSASYPSGLAAGTVYGTEAFNHLHSSESSARAWEIAGRTQGSRFGGSNITNWLGQSDTKVDGTAYTGATFTGENAPDTYFMLIGTNDLLSDGNNATLSSRLSTVTENLLGDMDTIHASMRASNADAKLVVLNIPCWTTHANGNSEATHQAVADYNASLKTWAEGKAAEGVTLVDVNKGMVDVASATPFFGVSSMFRAPGSDGLHPNAQGDLIMAGNVAQQLGYAGRTAGQERMAASAFAMQADAIHAASALSGTVSLDDEEGSLILESGASLSFNWAEGTDLSKGFTVDFALDGGLGDGAENGWTTGSNLSITLGEGSFSGTLNIDEAYIRWGDSVLYSMDTSTLTTAADSTLRVSYINGNPNAGLSSGYYVWMGDMLIGEGLSGIGSSTALNGLSVSNASGASVTLGHLSLDAQSWAPETTRFTNGNPLIAPVDLGERVDHTTSVPSSGDITGSLGLTEGYNVITVNDDRISSGLTVNSGNYAGELVVIVTGDVQFGSNSHCSLHTGAGSTLDGNVTLTVDEHHAPSVDRTWGTLFGVVNATAVTGNVNMNLLSDNLVVMDGAYSYNNVQVHASVAGAFKGNVTGGVNIDIGGGTFGSSIYGGVINGENYSVGSTTLNLHGGIIKGSVYAGGVCGTVEGDTSLTISGGVTVQGNTVSSGGDFSTAAWTADGRQNTIKGASTLILTQVKDGDNFAAYSGVISGGLRDGSNGVQGNRSLFIDNVQLSQFNASLENFDSVSVRSGSELSLSGLGGASSLSVDAASRLTLTAEANAPVSYDMQEVSNAGQLVIGKGVSLAVSYTGDTQITAEGTYEVQGGSLDFKGQSLAGSVTVCSGTLAGASAVSGGITLDVNTLASHRVTLGGDMTLAEVKLALGESANTLAASAIVVDGGAVSVSGSLTLNLDGTLSELLAAQLPGQQAAPLSITLTGEVDPLAQSLLLASGKLDVDVEQVNISLAEGYENYTVKATGIVYDEADNATYVTYEVSQSVPEPASATLSLLALAALAARRRRRA